jgi:uncharacterized protein YfaS (alpha-2-macroglobulin family)
MAAPILNLSLDKGSYAPGETARLTVSYSDPDNATTTLSVTGTDSGGNPATMTVQLVVADPVTLTVTDPARTWTKVSDTGAVAIYSATV